MPIPTSLQATLNLLADYAHPFAICGGWAIDLYLNRITRDHNDIDIAIERRHQHHLHAYLSERGWSLDIAHHGQLTPWYSDDWLELPHHAIWCHHPTYQPDFVEFLLSEMDDHTYHFRRDLTLTCPRHQAFIVSAVGISILAPELALLYKATRPDRDYNTRDFLTCLPALDRERRTWLKTALTQLDTNGSTIYNPSALAADGGSHTLFTTDGYWPRQPNDCLPLYLPTNLPWPHP